MFKSSGEDLEVLRVEHTEVSSALRVASSGVSRTFLDGGGG